MSNHLLRLLRRLWSLICTLARPRRLVALFLCFGLATGAELAFLTPIGQVADEPTQLARADGLLYGQLLGHRVSHPHLHQVFSGVITDIATVRIWQVMLEHGVGNKRVSPAQMAEARAVRWSRRTTFFDCPNTVTYFPALYLPATIGLGFGRLAGLSPWRTVLLGRVMMLAAFLAMGAAALALARWGHALLFATQMLPMTMSLAASFDIDGQLIGAAALAAALLTSDPAREPGRRRLAALLLCLVIMAKPPYGLLLFLGLLPLAQPRRRALLVRLSLLAVPPLIWIVVIRHVASAPLYYAPPYHPGPLWPGPHDLLFTSVDPADNLRGLIAHPGAALLLPVRDLAAHALVYLREAIGVLGWLSVTLPRWQYRGWGLALLAAFIGTMLAGPAERRAARDAGLAALLVLGSVWAVMMAVYLSWTYTGYDRIDGIQGRYFLVILPFLAFVRPGPGWAPGSEDGRRAIETLAALPAVVMALADLAVLPQIFARIFY